MPVLIRSEFACWDQQQQKPSYCFEHLFLRTGSSSYDRHIKFNLHNKMHAEVETAREKKELDLIDFGNTFDLQGVLQRLVFVKISFAIRTTAL